MFKMIINIPEILMYVAVMMIAVMVHEFGHWIVLKVYGKKAKLRFTKGSIQVVTYNNEKDWDKYLDKQQYKMTLLAGVVAGMIPIVAMPFILFWVKIILLIAYLIGARADIKHLMENTE